MKQITYREDLGLFKKPLQIGEAHLAVIGLRKHGEYFLELSPILFEQILYIFLLLSVSFEQSYRF